MKIKELIMGDKRISEMIRFGIVGVFATGLQYGIYVVFVNAVGVPAVPSTLISYAISFIANFFLSSYFTFNKRPDAQKGIGFTLSHLINMGMQTGMVAIFKGLVGKTLALLPALGICIPINYLLVRYVFTHDFLKSKKGKKQSYTKKKSKRNNIQSYKKKEVRHSKNNQK